MKVKKRNNSFELIDLNKIHVMVERSCKNLTGVSASQVEIQSGIQFYDGITTEEIQQILIKSASDLISLSNPNYQYVAARLLLFSLYKQIFKSNNKKEFPNVHDHLCAGVSLNIYDVNLLSKYSMDEWDIINEFVDHDRDFLFTYAGLQQVLDKYLVQDRSTKKVFETPQYMYILIAATLFQNYSDKTRLSYIKKYYDAISKHKINIPTPIMAGVRTPLKQFASCTLIDIDDSLDSIFSSDMAIGYYVSQRSGIGINAGRIRSINSKIREGEVTHTGVIPFLKKFESTVRCCTQNGIRGGCFDSESEVLIVESVEIDGINYSINDEINGIEVIDIINSHNGNKTIIKINLSKKKISNISVGDIVYCYDEFNNVFCVNKVSDTFTPTIKKEYQEKIIVGNNETLYTSSIHPFYDGKNKKWIEAQEIENIFGLDETGSDVIINNDHSYVSDSDETFYDFTVDRYHNYFVGKNNIFVLTHNSATVHFPIWHKEIEDIIVLKNNKGTEDNRVRKLDYSIQLSKLFYERFIRNEEISLFSPHDVPEVNDNFGLDTFDQLYLEAEKNQSIPRKTIKAQELILNLLKERAETGRIYIMNIDHCNSHSSFIDKIWMSNLCVSGNTQIRIRYVKPQHDDVGQIYDREVFNEEIQIKELEPYIRNNSNTIEVLSYDIETGDQKWASIISFAQTSPKSKVMKITHEETGKSIVVTPDHKVFTKNRGYVMAKNLTENDELVIN